MKDEVRHTKLTGDVAVSGQSFVHCTLAVIEANGNMIFTGGTPNQIKINFKEGKISVEGDWDESAKMFLDIIEQTLLKRMGKI